MSEQEDPNNPASQEKIVAAKKLIENLIVSSPDVILGVWCLALLNVASQIYFNAGLDPEAFKKELGLFIDHYTGVWEEKNKKDPKED